MISCEDFLATARFKRMSDDKYKSTKDKSFLTEQKAPEHSYSYMKNLAKELDDAFLVPEGSSKRRHPPDSPGDDDDDDDNQDDDNGHGGRKGGGGGGKRSRRDKSDSDQSVDEDFNPSTPVKGKAPKDKKGASKSSKGKPKKRLNMETDSGSDRDRRSHDSNKSGSSSRSMSRDRHSSTNRRSTESNRSSTGSSKSNGSAKSNATSRSNDSGKSNGSRGGERSGSKPPSKTVKSPKSDTRMGRFTKE